MQITIDDIEKAELILFCNNRFKDLHETIETAKKELSGIQNILRQLDIAQEESPQESTKPPVDKLTVLQEQTKERHKVKQVRAKRGSYGPRIKKESAAPEPDDKPVVIQRPPAVYSNNKSLYP